MHGYLTTQQVASISGASVDIINAYAREDILKPARYGKRSVSHLWGLPSVLGIGAGQVLFSMGMRGAPVRNAVNMIGSMAECDLELALESRPVLCVLPGTAVVGELVSRDFVHERAAEMLAELGVSPVGIDLEKMWKRMQECIAEHEKTGWEEPQEVEQ